MRRGGPRSRWAWAVAALTAAVFARSLTASFLGLDDPVHILRNEHLRLASLRDLRFVFGLEWVHWYPLTWLSFCLDRALWGLNPFGFHLTSVILHSLNAALAFLLLAELMGLSDRETGFRGPAAAAFGALLFSLHPLRAESVTWVTERSDVLCASFYLAAVLAWLRGRGGAALALHAVGLTAKGVGMSVPLVLIILDALGLSRRPWPGMRRALALSSAAWRRQGDWLDSESFWSSEAATDPRNAIARHFLGLERLKQGRAGEAEALVRSAVSLDPGLGPARNSLANILARAGRFDESLLQYREALRLLESLDAPSGRRR